VAGGDNHRPTGFFGEDTKADDRSGRGTGAKVDFNAIAGDDLGYGGGEVLGSKAGVITNNQSATG
jgi:hypothetical protein